MWEVRPPIVKWNSLLVVLLIPKIVEAFELDTKPGQKVACLQCVQVWRSANSKEAKGCSNSHAKTCTGDACFMRQCKHCPVYQFMAGCIQLTPWQMADLEVNRRRSEVRMRRVGADMLCEDSFNQTTCICNRRDKCNSIHTRVPFSTYAEGIFAGVVDFDQIIGEIDPRYTEVMSGYHYRFHSNSMPRLSTNFTLFLLLFLLFSHFTNCD